LARIIFLDAGPLGLACNELGNGEPLAIWNWIWNEVDGGSKIVIPEITDYEVRRNLLCERFSASLARLDDLSKSLCTYLPITTPSIRQAAELWAQARRGGDRTSGEQSIDGDVILAAQTLTYCSNADDWWVATSNEKHLSRYLGDRARSWRQIPLASEVRETLRQLKSQQDADPL